MCSMICLIGIALDVLDQGQVLFAVDVQGQQGVGGADGQRGGLGRQGDVDRLCAVAVDDGGDQVGHACTAGVALAEFGAQFCCELLLRHGYLLEVLNGVQQGRRSGTTFNAGRPGRPIQAGCSSLKEMSDPVDNGDLRAGHADRIALPRQGIAQEFSSAGAVY